MGCSESRHKETDVRVINGVLFKKRDGVWIRVDESKSREAFKAKIAANVYRFF